MVIYELMRPVWVVHTPSMGFSGGVQPDVSGGGVVVVGGVVELQFLGTPM